MRIEHDDTIRPYEGTRADKTNPRALSNNPRARGNNPRSKARNKWALRNWKRTQRKRLK